MHGWSVLIYNECNDFLKLMINHKAHNLLSVMLFAADLIMIVVEADVIGLATSEQFTTVPFKPMPTESIDNVEIRGEAP